MLFSGVSDLLCTELPSLIPLFTVETMNRSLARHYAETYSYAPHITTAYQSHMGGILIRPYIRIAR